MLRAWHCLHPTPPHSTPPQSLAPPRPTLRDRRKSKPEDSALAKLPSYVTHAILSFMYPDTSYSSGTSLTGTGLDFSSDGSVVKAAIALLKQRNPKTKVGLVGEVCGGGMGRGCCAGGWVCE